MPIDPLEITGGLAIGEGVGGAIADVVIPRLQNFKNSQWNAHPNVPLTAEQAAMLEAENSNSPYATYVEALNTGYKQERYDAILELVRSAPDFGTALNLWRRGDISDELWSHALYKAHIEPGYFPGLNKLIDEKLSPPVVALAIVRGLMDAPFPLPFTPPAGVGNVPAFPKSTLDALAEAKAFGFDVDRLFVQTAISGRPMGPEAAASAFFREILKKDDYLRAILEGDVRGEWAEAILEHARQIPSVADYINAEIRGWIDTTERNAGIAKHGMSPADGDLLYKRTGRPATSHQVHIGWARGGRNAAAGTTEQEVFAKAIKESDIRPEWQDLLWAQRYTYPPFFALRTLMQGGVLDQAEAEQILHFAGWEPSLAKRVSTFFTTQTTTTAKGNPWVAKAEQHWWTEAQKAYIKNNTLRSVIEPVMETFVPDLADRDAIFQWWTDTAAVIAGVPPA